jgi:GTP cyclohydrolase III
MSLLSHDVPWLKQTFWTQDLSKERYLGSDQTSTTTTDVSDGHFDVLASTTIYDEINATLTQSTRINNRNFNFASTLSAYQIITTHPLL